ncbi:MAG: hypothetical protein L0J84_05895 [Brachybacterium sp.]|nr:hypothetical protein [Brachybacterium sp.]
MPDQSLGVQLVPAMQPLAHQLAGRGQPHHRERAADGVLVVVAVLPRLDHPGGEEHLRTRLAHVRRDGLQVHELQTVLEGVPRRGGPGAAQPVKIERGPRDSASSQLLPDRVDRGGLADPDGADQEQRARA